MRSVPPKILLFLTGMVASSCALWGFGIETKPAVEKVLLPTYAFQDKTGKWNVQVNGWIYRYFVSRISDEFLVEKFRQKHAIPKPAEDEDDEVKDSQTKNFHDRAHRFLIKNIRRDNIPSRLGGESVELGPSEKDGHLHRTIPFNPKGGIDGWLQFELDTPDNNSCPQVGRVQLIQREGWSVISDIDDTIKVSTVWNKEELLANTFLRDFEAVNGMAQIYKLWEEKQASFHYVSASPWPLYRPLDQFLCDKQFPKGTIHLKPFDWDSPRELHDLFKEKPKPYKIKIIELILERFPNRKFVLFGDSTEEDPEAYGDLAKQYPGQIAAICIRAVNYDTRMQKQMTTDRQNKAFPGRQELGNTVEYKVFKDPSDLREIDPETKKKSRCLPAQ